MYYYQALSSFNAIIIKQNSSDHLGAHEGVKAVGHFIIQINSLQKNQQSIIHKIVEGQCNTTLYY